MQLSNLCILQKQFGAVLSIQTDVPSMLGEGTLRLNAIEQQNKAMNFQLHNFLGHLPILPPCGYNLLYAQQTQ